MCPAVRAESKRPAVLGNITCAIVPGYRMHASAAGLIRRPATTIIVQLRYGAKPSPQRPLEKGGCCTKQPAHGCCASTMCHARLIHWSACQGAAMMPSHVTSP
eukprot:365017-Chlamydomonas_euryale.AAC.2